MDVYWLLYNPLMYDMLNVIFGIILVLGVGLFVYHLILLIMLYRKRQVVPRLILSLILIGISVRWEWFIPVLSEAMGGAVQYLSLYLYYMIYQYIAQHGFTATALIL
ncbi:MAG: hypothetical protein ACTSP1_14860 [Candidatus Freyarchaeota archaeon]